ncbi:chemotaxis protein [Arsukibacterium ikkense]|uniref:Chemotaxis protein n=1 Tax=Arsukibacterium ikkense TaxID=336831 RepID=A0A0M2V2W6_9GAMM|nr:cache domain-containing protein [Arsukibacterium ikkense]KKO44729.1 chemotaxis protein [Arsukibacterium ikkense]
MIKTICLPALMAFLLLISVPVSSEPLPHSESVVALTIKNLSANVDNRISNMKLLANTIANDAHIHAWRENGFTPGEEPVLISKLGYLVQQYELTSASFADTKSHKYWNHEGFLRVLVPEVDTWYFAYLQSGKQDQISVYHDKNKNRVDLYINYRQANGYGLSGIATSFDGVVRMLQDSPLSQQGELFIVDHKGVIQVHPDPDVAGKFSLEQRYSKETSQHLLKPQAFNHTTTVGAQQQYLVSSYIPSMGWYLVAQLTGELY